MARTLSAAVAALVATKRAITFVLLKVVADDGTTFRFWNGAGTLVFGGFNWLPYLMWDGEIRWTRGLEINGGSVKLTNVDLTIAKNLRDTDFEGAVCTFEKFFIEVQEAVPLAELRIVSSMVREHYAEFRLASGLVDPTAVEMPRRDYNALCPWKYKDADTCAATAPEATCNKTHADCTTRANTHRFGGFIHVSRDLTEAIQGAGAVPPPSGDEGERSPGDWAHRGLELP